MDFKSLLFSFDGRINRGKWWLSLLIYIIFWIAVSIVGYVAMMAAGVIGIAVFVVAGIVAIVSGIAVGVKRLHDRNKSGWWLALFYLVPSVLQGVGAVSGSEAIGMLLNLIGAGISIWMIVELGCLRGTVGPNQYGSDPLEGAGIPAPV